MQTLLTMRGRCVLGETRRWKVVRVPSTEDAVLRQPHRELMALKAARTQPSNRMKGLLAGRGLEAVIDPTGPERLPALRQWAGQPVPARLPERLLREFARWSLGQRQIQDGENAEARLVRDDQPRRVAQVRTLRSGRGIGAQSAWLLGHEVLGWREIRNRRELAALAGLTPTPYHSGQSQREHGLGTAGSNRLRWPMVEWAWGWLHWPPESDLSRWSQARFGQGRARLRTRGIGALARKLLIALWRLGADGEIPPGAVVADGYRKVTGRGAKRRPVGTAVAV